MDTKQIARERLYFLAFFAVGFIVGPFILTLVFGQISDYPAFYEQMFGKHFLIAWVIVLGPYLLFQFVRSLVWGWKTVRNHENNSHDKPQGRVDKRPHTDESKERR